MISGHSNMWPILTSFKGFTDSKGDWEMKQTEKQELISGLQNFHGELVRYNKQI